MANNQYVNKVIFGSSTLVDLTDTTATADKILSGYGAYGADGAWMDGTATGGASGVVYITDEIDEHGGTVRNIVTDDATITDTLDEHGGTVRSITGAEVYLQSRTVQPTESAQRVTPTGDYNALGAVNVGAIPSDYVGSSITRRSDSDLSAWEDWVTVPAGYYAQEASASVGTAEVATPTATKGSVSNHSVTVTPSITQPYGYVTGGTKTGTAVTVSASELVSGTYTVDSSGTKDVTNYASVSVPLGSVQPASQIYEVSNVDVKVSEVSSNGYVELSKTITNNNPNITQAGYINSVTAGSTKVLLYGQLPSGTEGAPIATKGSVNNHSISVTPSVTNTAGYITGSTKTGTAVTVTASELASGNKAITENGNNIDVVGYSTVSVNVSGGGGGGTPMQMGNLEGSTAVTSSISFTGLQGEPTAFSFMVDANTATGTPAKIVAVVFDGTNLHAQTITNTSNAQVTYDSTSLSKTYSNGTLTITSSGPSFITDYYYGVYTYGGAVDTKDVQVGSGATSITFSGLEDEPDYWSCIFKSNFSTSSGYQRVIFVATGNNLSVVSGLEMDSGAHNAMHWTASYNNGSLTITSQGTNSGGYFHQPGYYQLTYAYDNGGGGNYQTKTVTPTTSQQIVTADSGYDALSQVTVNAMPTGTAGTPTATKGSVSNNSISVTPSVTNTTGYITGSTKTGTAVTVSASELVSGTRSITSNGTGIDVTNYASVNVNVSGSGIDLPIFTIDANDNISCNKTYSECNDFIVDNELDAALLVDAIEGTTYPLEAVGPSPNGIKYYATSVGVPNLEITYNYNGTIDVVYPSSVLDTLTVTSNGSYTAPYGKVYNTVNVNVSGGGGDSSSYKKQINFIDYDGTILHSYSKAEWQSVSTLPSNPSHTGLTSQGWNWTKAQIDAQLTAMPDGDVWVGQMYITDDGKTRIYIHLEDGRLHPYLGICPNGTVVVDWGDNSATSTLTGTSLTTVKVADHTYASSGDYMITLTVSSGSFAFYGVSNTAYLLRKENSTTENIHRVYSNAVQKVEIGASASIGAYAFRGCNSLASITIPSSVTSISTYAFYTCYSLASITIPSSVTSIGTYAFNSCYSLASITIPSSVTSIGTYAFYNCYSFANITIPSSVTSIGTYAFYYCYSLASITIPSGVTSIGNNVFNSCVSLASITIPSGVTSIGNNVFQGCYSLASITIPSSVTSIGTNAFYACLGVAEYHIKPTTPPTLANTNAFTNIQSDCVIYVPSASLSTYQTASNWSTYASYMKGE